MKRNLSVVVAVIVAFGLTACSGESSSTQPSATPSTSQAKVLRHVPDVSGLSYSKAKIELIAQGLQPVFRSEDGATWGQAEAGEYALVVSTEPGAGAEVESGTRVEITLNMTETAAAAKMQAAEAAAVEAEKLATRYTFSCSTNGYGADKETTVYHSYSDVWLAPNYNDMESCDVEIEGESTLEGVDLREEEKAIANIISDKGGDASIPSYAFGNTLALCAKPPFGYPNDNARSSKSTQALAAAALALCPNAPHAALLQTASTTATVKDGTFVVGDEMEAGTYQTRAGVKDCYWSRTTGGGDIIANEFIGFAPAGATVTVNAGEGFESSRCGTWTKVA